MRLIRGFQGELGLKIRYHVPQVATLCKREPCRVEIEEGEEALYPFAAEHVIVPRADDASRRGMPPKLGVPETRFVPEPNVTHGINPTDIVLCPRARKYGAEKNWNGWVLLAARLWQAGLTTFAAGAPDSSERVPYSRLAWDEERFLDASIEAMRKTRLVIATDAGLAHLAVLCGAPLLIVTYRGLVAPGPVINSAGKIAHEHYWPVRLDEYYRKAAHTGAPIETVDGWEDVGKVVAAAEVMLRMAA